MKKKLLLLLTVVTLSMLLFSGCAAGPNTTEDIPDAEGKTAGFWSGLWHGIISPITFIISLFSDNVNIYEVYNNGAWYNFGFIVGVCVIFSGGSRASRRKRGW